MSEVRRGPAESAEVRDTLAGGGELGALMRSMDWSATRLGPVQRWPQSLRTTVSTCLNSRFPILIWWGPELAMLYNDAFKQIIGTKHPQSLGAPGREVWPEIWDVIGPMLDSVRRDGKGTWSENLRLLLNRFGFVEETYFTFGYSPIRDESGGIGGVFSAISETTGQVLSERRLRALRDIAALTTGARSTEEACRLAAQAMDGYGDDIPFALLYTVEDREPHLVGSAGVHAAARAGSSWQPQLDEVLRTQRPALVGLQPRPDASCERALILPIGLPGEARPSAVMIAGLSVRLAFDDRYRSFLELMAGTLASAAAGARARSALEHRWEEVRDILRLLPVAIAIVTLPEERYELVNHAYLELMGRDPTGRTLDEAWSDLPPQALERLRELRRRALSSEEPVLLPDVPRTAPPGAQERHYAVSMRVWTDLAGRRRLISTATDVTDQVVARRQIEQSREQIARSERELRKAVTLRDDFFTMASHELRTPLTTLGLEAEGLLRSIEQAPLGDPPLERWAHRAARLAGQAMRLEQLIEGMLDLASLSGELSPGREEDLDLSDLARSVVERFREGSKQARSSITLLAEPVCGRWERRRLERILTQLVANALKFGANNPIDVAVGPAGERARIAIKDRGIGIQLEDQERIFGRFERAAPPEHYGGFGVGLWLVGQLVKSMSGSVRVDSRPGEGATFVIELPRRP